MRIPSDDELHEGIRLVADLPDLRPPHLSVRMQRVYDDIRETLRVPLVNLVFRKLANFPDYLAFAWGRFGPYLRTLALERAADALRAQALIEPIPDATHVEWDALGDMERIRPFTETIHYVLPKLLLAASAFHEGLLPDGSPLPRPDPSPPVPEIPPGIAQGATRIPLVDPDTAPREVIALLERVQQRHHLPAAPTYYRALGHWPRFLEAVWERLEPVIQSQGYAERKAALLECARDTVVRLPLPRPEEAPDLILSPSQLHQIRSIVPVFRFKFIPSLLLDVSLVRAMMDGPQAARTSRFSAATTS